MILFLLACFELFYLDLSLFYSILLSQVKGGWNLIMMMICNKSMCIVDI